MNLQRGWAPLEVHCGLERKAQAQITPFNPPSAKRTKTAIYAKVFEPSAPKGGHPPTGGHADPR